MHDTTGQYTKVQLFIRLFTCAARHFFANKSESVQVLRKRCDNKGQFYNQLSSKSLRLIWMANLFLTAKDDPYCFKLGSYVFFRPVKILIELTNFLQPPGSNRYISTWETSLNFKLYIVCFDLYSETYSK